MAAEHIVHIQKALDQMNLQIHRVLTEITGLNRLSVIDDVQSDLFALSKEESDSMLNQLFFRSDALTRQLSALLVDERCQYLAECAAQGMARRTLRVKARLFPSIAEYLRLAERPDDTISLSEIEKAASRWPSRNWPSLKTS
jgi:hypothetical protein